MTDKPRPSDDAAKPEAANDGHETVLPEAGTVQFSPEEIFSALEAVRTPSGNAASDVDQTIDLSQSIDADATIDIDPTMELESQVVDDETFDPWATDVDEEGQASPVSEADEVTANKDEAPGSTGATTIVPVPSNDLQPVKDEVDQTVAFSEVDQTVEFESVSSVAHDATVDLGTTAVDQPAPRRSVMFDTNVTQTINPRELSQEDALEWSLAANKSNPSADISRLSPAINRSLSETRLNLRGQVLSDARSEQARTADYRIVRLLGKGGMGNVYVARQGSLDRLVALKVIKPLEDAKREQFKRRGTLAQVEQERRLQFISEAVVTGDLDHPNIVPIHDIAVASDNSLFYSMKRVSGTPWSKVIHERTREQNIDTLLKVCDAIGFAHTRGVVHRDIKPENIMLGEFGVVMVMDWGLALAKPEFEKLDSVHQSTGLGGSPAYMAPEMAIGPVDRIGPASDIYLLGATLFQIITGWAPHQATNVSECLKVVASNTIREVPPKYHSELLNIAMKAMATRIEDRYPSVPAFQEAIRTYLSHSASIDLANSATGKLEQARSSGSYDDYARAISTFEESLKSWDGNERAIAGLVTARIAYAEEAERKGEYDLGLSLLDRGDATHQALIEKLEKGKRDRLAREKRLSRLYAAAAAMLAFIILGGAAAIYVIAKERKAEAIARLDAEANATEARRQTQIADRAAKKAEDEAKRANAAAEQEKAAKLLEEKAKQEAVAAKVIAERATEKEEAAKLLAEKAKEEAVVARDLAKDSEAKAIKEKEAADIARANALYENYISQIGLAKARIEQNNFDEARRILLELKADAKGEEMAWEWRWLWRQTTQDRSAVATTSPVNSLYVSSSADRVLAVTENGELASMQLDPRLVLTAEQGMPAMKQNLASAAVHSADGKRAFVGTKSGDLEVWDSALGVRSLAWPAHRTNINRLALLDDKVLVSASDDRRVCLWDLRDGSLLATCWNLGPVKDLSLVRAGDGWLLAAAVAESQSGRVTLWQLTSKGEGWDAKLVGEFLGHEQPVLAVSLSPVGSMVASGDATGNVLVWDAQDVRTTDYESDITKAIQRLSGSGSKSLSEKATRAPKNKSLSAKVLMDPETVLNQSGVNQAGERAHADRIRVLRFSPDGHRLLSGGEDYLLRIWDTRSLKRIETLRGHGGWILDAAFLNANGDRVLSSSADSTMRTWQVSRFVNAAVVSSEDTPAKTPLHQEEILSARLNPAGDAVVTAGRDRTAIVSRINPLTMKAERIAELKDEADTVALKEGTTFIAQASALNLEDGLLYVASADAVVRVWDLHRGTEWFEMQDTGLNSSIALSYDGRYLLTRSSATDAQALLWRCGTTRDLEPFVMHRLAGHAKGASVTALAISFDGSKAFTADNTGVGILWDARTGKPIGKKIESLLGYRINAAAFVADGEELLIAADDQQVTRIDLRTRAVMSKLPHSGFVTQLSLSPDEKFVVTLNEQSTRSGVRTEVLCWNLADKTKQRIDVATAKGSGTRIASAEFSIDGKSIAVTRSNESDGASQVLLWELDSAGKWDVAKGFEVPAALGEIQTATSVGPSQLLTLNGDAAFLWDTDRKSQLISYRANAAVHSANFSSDGRFVITGSHSVKIWDVKEQRSVAKIELPHDAPMTHAEFTPKAGSYQFATSARDGSIKLHDFDPATTQTREVRSWPPDERGRKVNRVRFSVDGTRLLAVGDGGMARVIRLDAPNDGEAVSEYGNADAGNFICGAFSSDGRYIMVGSDNKQAFIWAIVGPDEEAVRPVLLQGHSDQIEDVKFLASGAGPLRVLTASRDKSAKVWDPRLDDPNGVGREVLNLRKHTQGLTAIDASNDGTVVITAGRDATLVVWPASEP